MSIHNRGIIPEDLLNSTVGGITLRDWLAGQAMMALLSNPALDLSEIEDVVCDAYRYSDAMLTFRIKSPTPDTSIANNRSEFKAIAEKMLTFEGISDYQRGYCHGQIDAADTISEGSDKQDQIAKAAPDMLEALKKIVNHSRRFHSGNLEQSTFRVIAKKYGEQLDLIRAIARDAIAKAKGGQS